MFIKINFMKNLSLKMDDAIVSETEKITGKTSRIETVPTFAPVFLNYPWHYVSVAFGY